MIGEVKSGRERESDLDGEIKRRDETARFSSFSASAKRKISQCSPQSSNYCNFHCELCEMLQTWYLVESWYTDDFGSASKDKFNALEKLEFDCGTHHRKKCAGSLEPSFIPGAPCALT